MPEYRVVLKTPVAAEHEGELRSRVFYVSELITDFSLVAVDGQVTEVVLTTATPASVDDLARKLNLVVANDIQPMRVAPPKYLWRAPAVRPLETDLFAQLVDRGMAFESGAGQVAVGGDFLALMEFFDGLIRAAVRSDFDASEYRYPTLLPVAVLQRCGYLSSFPQHLMLVTRLHSDAETYAEFLRDVAGGGPHGTGLLDYCRNVDYCLPPTMCYHTFNQLSGGRVDDRVVTARGKSFRFESRYHRSLERLWDFTIREIVFLGSRRFVLDARQRFMRLVFDIIERLGLTAHCEVASDPFFCREDTAEQILTQRMMELKYELRLPVADDRTIACASFNFHDQFFAGAFGIEHASEPSLHSGCAGVGLERLTYAFLCQYGLDVRSWPREVQDVLGQRALSVG